MSEGIASRGQGIQNHKNKDEQRQPTVYSLAWNNITEKLPRINCSVAVWAGWSIIRLGKTAMDANHVFLLRTYYKMLTEERYLYN
jgi:hypothetical protein